MFDLQKFTIIGIYLGGMSVFRTANLIGFSRAPLSRFITAYKKLEKVSSAKQSSDRKSKLTGR